MRRRSVRGYHQRLSTRTVNGMAATPGPSARCGATGGVTDDASNRTAQAPRTIRLVDGREVVVTLLTTAEAPEPPELGEARQAPRRFDLVARDRAGEDVAIAHYQATAQPGVAEV